MKKPGAVLAVSLVAALCALVAPAAEIPAHLERAVPPSAGGGTPPAPAPAPAPVPETGEAPAAPAVVTPPVIIGATAGPERVAEVSPVEAKLGRIVSVNFPNTPIEDVLRALAAQADVDLVKSPKVTGNVTATLTDVPLAEALDSILSINDWGYIATDNVIRILPSAELKVQKPLASRIYRISFASIQDIEKTLKTVISANGKIAANVGTNNIVITDSEAQLKVIDEFIKEIDRETPQILVEARIYDVETSDGLDIGFQWFASSRTEYDPNTGKPVGGRTDPFASSLFDTAISRAPKTDSLLRFGVLNDDVDIDVNFTAAAESVKAKLLANPKILVVDNERANIKIVSEIPYQQLTQTSFGGNIGTTEFKEVGVQLEVTPHITRDGKIKLKVRPSFSVQTDTVSIVVPIENSALASPQPVVDKREAETSALISDGETVVIGGLRKKENLIENSKVPLLADIPLLGALFTFTGTRVINSELVVFITPRIITQPKLSSEESEDLQRGEEELSGIRETLAPFKERD